MCFHSFACIAPPSAQLFFPCYAQRGMSGPAKEETPPQGSPARAGFPRQQQLQTKEPPSGRCQTEAGSESNHCCASTHRTGPQVKLREPTHRDKAADWLIELECSGILLAVGRMAEQVKNRSSTSKADPRRC